MHIFNLLLVFNHIIKPDAFHIVHGTNACISILTLNTCTIITCIMSTKSNVRKSKYQMRHIFNIHILMCSFNCDVFKEYVPQVEYKYNVVLHGKYSTSMLLSIPA